MRVVHMVLLAAALTTPAVGQETRETLPDILAAALASNPSLEAQRKVRSGADEALIQAKAAARPTLSFTGSYTDLNDQQARAFALPGGGTSPPTGNFQRGLVGLEARQTLYAGGALGAQRRLARFGVTAAEARLNSYEQQLVLDVVTAFLDVRRGNQEVEIREATVASLSQQVQAAQDRFDAGDVTRTDIAQAQTRRAGVEATLAAAQTRLAFARATFERLVGYPAIQLAEPPPAPAIPPTLEAAIAAGLNTNPDILAARAAAESARESVNVAKGGLRPNLSLVGNAGLTDTHVDNAYTDTSLGVSVRLSIPLYQGDLAGSRTRGARLNADKARLDVRGMEREVVAYVTSAWEAVVFSRSGVAAAQTQVTAAQTAFDAAKQELTAGTRTTIDVLDQERELLEARLGLADAERAEYLYTCQLRAAIGDLSLEAFGE